MLSCCGVTGSLETRPPPGSKGGSVNLPDSALLLLRNSWGEVEWFLPLLYRLKEERPDLEIYTIFTCDRFYDQRKYFPTLYNLLDAISERIYRPLDVIGVDTDWGWPKTSDFQLIVERPPKMSSSLAVALERTNSLAARLRESFGTGRIDEDEYRRQILKLKPTCDQLQKLLDEDHEDRAEELSQSYFQAIFDRDLAGRNFDLILRDNCLAFGFHRLVHERFGNARVARGAHGFDLTNRTGDNVYKAFVTKSADLRHVIGEGDVWFTCSQNLTDCMATYWKISDCANVGFPRLDRWWVDTVLSASGEEVARMNLPPAKQRILWISRQMADSCFDREPWMRIAQGTMRLVQERPDVHLIVKPHPRQSIEQLLEALQPLPQSRWTLWCGSTMSAAQQADVVVSVWSSAILDCLAVGKPVIEYFEYEKESINQAPEASGEISGGWRSNGLAVPADSTREVHRLLDLWNADPNNEVWRNQRAAFERLHPENADHTGAAVREISELFAPGWRRNGRSTELR